MNDLFIAKTEATPEVSFKTSGQLSMKGRSLPEDPKIFYDILFEWVKGLSADSVSFDVQLDYVNTSSSKKVLELFKMIDGNEKVREFTMNWYYDVDDSDMLEFGDIIERRLTRVTANYIECEDID